MRPLTTAACLLTVTGSALAQTQGTATYSIAFGSTSGPNSVVLQPGETTEVFVNVSFTPGVGSGNPPAGGLSDGAFSISGSGTGAGLWIVDDVYFSPTYSLPYPWNFWGAIGTSPGYGGPGGVSDVVWGYGFIFQLPHPYPQNPANVWRGKVAAESAGVINTAFVKLSSTSVFAGQPGQLPTVLSYKSSAGLGGHVTILACYADCDGSRGLTIADFGCFQAKFAAADPYADCDHNGSHTIGDFGCFQARFVAGCP